MAKTNFFLGGLLDQETKELTEVRLSMPADELRSPGWWPASLPRRREELVSGAEAVLGVFMGRRSGTRAASAASRRSRTQRAEQAIQASQDRPEAAAAAVLALEEERDQIIADTRSEWNAKADWIEDREIGPGKTSMQVQEVRVVWVPIG